MTAIANMPGALVAPPAAKPLRLGLDASQLALRRTGLTATDMKKLAGVDPHGGTPFDVYVDKVGEPVNDTEEVSMAKRLGHMGEAMACEMVAQERGLVLAPATTERHWAHDWVIATPDRNVLDKPGGRRYALVEAKLVGAHMLHRWKDGHAYRDQPPDEVLIQVNWQMCVTSTKRCYVAAILGGTDYHSWVVERDEDLYTSLLEYGDAFMRHHVIPRVPPSLDDSESAARMVKGLFRRNTRPLLRADDEANKLARAILAAAAAGDELEAQGRAAKSALQMLIGEAEGMTGDGWECSWKNDRSGGVDWKGLAATFAPGLELVERFTRPGPRKFLLKPINAKKAPR
jgi:predicted phage-related endonuclease